MSKKAFTLAEVLITLTIIGIVAAIVVPSLFNDINDKVWVSKRAALYSRMSNAIANMEKLNGFGKYEVVTNEDNSTTTTDTASESFVIDGLSKVYKIKRVCGPDNFAKCGPKYQFTNMAGQAKNFPSSMSELLSGSGMKDTRATSFETFNGEMILAYYNPECINTRSDLTTITLKNGMCVNFIYDLNGAKLPNQVGKDIGVMTAYVGTGISPEVVAPNPILADKLSLTGGSTLYEFSDAINVCENTNSDFTLPNMWETASLVLNSNLTVPKGRSLYDASMIYWTSTAYSAGNAGKAWVYNKTNNTLSVVQKTNRYYLNCIMKQ